MTEGYNGEGIPRVYKHVVAPVSLGYPLSVFNKNSTLNCMSDCLEVADDVHAFRLNEKRGWARGDEVLTQEVRHLITVILIIYHNDQP